MTAHAPTRHADAPTGPLRVFFDGALMRQPNGEHLAAAGWFIYAPDGRTFSGGRLLETQPYLRLCHVEYLGAIHALEALAHSELGWHGQVLLVGDSKWLLDEIRGDRVPRGDYATELRDQVRAALTAYPDWRVLWVPREGNGAANAAAGRALEEGRAAQAAETPA